MRWEINYRNVDTKWLKFYLCTTLTILVTIGAGLINRLVPPTHPPTRPLARIPYRALAESPLKSVTPHTTVARRDFFKSALQCMSRTNAICSANAHACGFFLQ